MEGTNIFDLVESGSHNRLRRLLEENLGSVSKEAIASALRHQGTTFESLLARAEKAKEQGDSGFFAMSGEAPRFLGPSRAGDGAAAGRARNNGRGGGFGGGAADLDGSTDDWESEVTNSACESQGRTSSSAGTSSGGGGNWSSSGSSGGSGGTIRRNFPGASGAGSSGSAGGASEADVSSGGVGGSGGGGGGSGGDVKVPWVQHQRRLPPLGPAAFPARGVKAGATATVRTARVSTQGKSGVVVGAMGNMRQAGATRPGGPSSCASVSSDGAISRDGGAGVGRKPEAGSDWSGEKSAGGGSASGVDGAGGRKGSMVNVDRDLQSKINAFTNAQKVGLPLSFWAVVCLGVCRGGGGGGRLT